MPRHVVCRFCKDQFSKRADDSRELCQHCHDLIIKMIHDAIVGTDRDTFAFTDEYLSKKLGQMAVEIKKEIVARLQKTDTEVDSVIQDMNERVTKLGQDYTQYQLQINDAIKAMQLQKPLESNVDKQTKKRGRPPGSKNKTSKGVKHKKNGKKRK